MAPAPLFSRFSCLHSDDPEEVRAAVSQVFCEHRLSLLPGQHRLDTQVFFRRSPYISYGRMRYGATVDIDPGQLNDFYLLQLPIIGSEIINLGHTETQSTEHTASLISPTVPFHMRHHGDTEKLFLRIDRDWLERICANWQGAPLLAPLIFQSTLDLRQNNAQSLRTLLEWSCAEASDGDLFTQPLFASSSAESLGLALLQLWPHNARTTERQNSATPHAIRRAREYIEANAHQDLTASQIAGAVGLSTRSLYAGFRQHHQHSPMKWLREVRLDRVRAELLQAGPTTQVTDVALRWGFGHLGQFAKAYHARFGELPSATLRRA